MIGRIAALFCMLAGLATPVFADGGREIARRHFKAGAQHYAAGDWRAALSEFRAARAADPLPALDFNLGRCLERLGRTDEAVAAYRSFADATTDPFDADEARARIRALRPEAGPAVPTVAPAPRRPRRQVVDSDTEGTDLFGIGQEVPPARSPSLVPPLAVGGVALVVAIVGVALYGAAHTQFTDFEGSCAPRCAASLWAGLDTREQVGIGLLVAAGALVVLDGVLWGLAREPRRERRTWIAPSLGGLAVGGSF
jgi:hypothetical protein